MKALKEWITAHRGQLKDLHANVLLRSQVLMLEQHRFVIVPPGRARLFWFLIRQNYAFRPLQTWKFTLFNYLMAFASLGLGYRTTKSAQAWQTKMIENIRSLMRRHRAS
jgi:hypothetical protein